MTRTPRPYDSSRWKCWPPCDHCTKACIDTKGDPRPLIARWLEWRARKEGIWLDEEKPTE